MKKYEIIEHTADIGIRVRGANLKELFRNTALAMFDIIAEKKPGIENRESRIKNFTLKQKAEGIEELFVNWLNELLSLSATKELIFSDFKIDKLDENSLRATAIAKEMRNYKINTEIKAATYHNLKLKETQSGWEVEVIFDV